jgi:hypothetical protein
MTRKARSLSLIAAAAGIAFALGLLLVACGGSSAPSSSGQSDSSSQALFKKLLAARFAEAPQGYGAPTYGQQALDAIDKDNGLVGIVKITFAGTSDTLLFGVYSDLGKATTAAQDFSGLLPSGGARKSLPYLPGAICADGSTGGTCGIQAGVVFVLAAAKSVDGGAGTLVQAGDVLVNQILAASPSPTPAN